MKKQLCCFVVNHMFNLKELGVSGNSGIDDLGIQKLNLIKLYACDNPKIKNVNQHTRSVFRLAQQA